MNILFVLTSHDKLGDTGLKTGFWMEELSAPFYVFKDAGHQVTLASPKGGKPPLDPKSDEPDFQTESTKRFSQDEDAKKQLANTVMLDSVSQVDFDAVFYPGGHGPLWDLAEDAHSVALIEGFYKAGKPVGLVCHAPAALQHCKNELSKPLVEGKRVTGFSNSEEAAVQLTEIVPFLIEDMIKNKGGEYVKGEDWSSYVVVDGHLITGQNPASSEAVADAILEKL